MSQTFITVTIIRGNENLYEIKTIFPVLRMCNCTTRNLRKTAPIVNRRLWFIINV